MLEIEFRAMGCQMKAVIDSESSEAERQLRQVPGWFEAWEATLSRFRVESELSQLNLHSGQWVRVSDTMLAVVQSALRMSALTDGLVDPTVLPALELAGYDRSFDTGLGMSPGAIEAIPMPAGMWRAIELDVDGRRIRVPAGVRLDMGGVAKGWAADRAVERLAETAPALVDASGDISVRGPLHSGDPWPIDVANPIEAGGDPLALLTIDEGFIATSGRDRRRWQTEQGWQHHIIDPRTGSPSKSDVLAATVVAPDGETGEASAKAALLLGQRLGLAWIETHPGSEGLLVTDDGTMQQTSGWNELVWRP